ncbi:hypothetical protein ACIQTT_02370 [Microbacterium sp. NPDC090225]|uniref:hypothetical protein n=1 Tax=Microbacterium sp. NPDC090225 TaxID=3364207 RepID=UPI00382FFA1E
MTLPTLEGARWVVRSTTDRLLRIATDFFAEQGFTLRGSAFPETADEAGWIAVALETSGRGDGAHRRSRLASLLSGRREESRQSATPQVVIVAAARRVSNGVAELVVYPHASPASAPALVETAAASIALALTAITSAAGAESAMLSHERLRSVPEDGCPASDARASEVLGWR